MWPFTKPDYDALNVACEIERWDEMNDIRRAVQELRLLGANDVAVASIDRLRLRLDYLASLDGISEHE